ncbi:hypothetical protein INT45_009908 [Circinella minor]|uniref:Integrase catalytic domain-containing protein n=1 Tax=Circinella minor TaxID=1195481 RepID=A0A8H7VAU6_9FUNG|nr:hypothetical protein INT45_009908 [Circinella minor]
MVYLNDILIMSPTHEDHERHVREVLRRFQENKIIANKKKCEFFKTELDFVGYHVTAAGILPSKKKVKAIQDWPICKNVQEVRQFIGLASHFRQWIRGFSLLSSVLTDLTKGTGIKKRSIAWTPECQATFDEIKTRLCDAPILVAPNPEEPYVIKVDSSDFAVGGVLLQKGSDGHLHPLAYESKKLSTAERNYPAQERELLAILNALRTWRCFVDGRHYTYKPGRDNHVPDLLSRRDGSACITQEKSMEPEFLYAVQSIQESDWPMFYALDEDKWPPMYKDLLSKHKDKFVVQNQQIFRLVKNGNQIQEVHFVLFVRHADLDQDFHKSVSHAGWLAACPPCQLAANADCKIYHVPMKLLAVPPAFSRWHLDFVSELPTTVNGNHWLLVAVDYATNWTIACAVPDATGEAIANFIYEEIVLPFSCPYEILTDRGANFMSKVLNLYLGRLQVNHLLTSAFHDQFVQPAVFACRVFKEQEPQESAIAKGRAREVCQLHQARMLAEQKLTANAAKDKAKWDAILKPQKLSVGDHVLMRHENRRSLEYNWKGPFQVLAVNLDTNVYQLQDLNGQLYRSWVHTDRLRPIHINSTVPTTPWFHPTTVRAAARAELKAAGHIAMLFEDVQPSREGVLS